MKQFFKNASSFLQTNWFKITISIVLIIIALSVAYYFVVFIPIKERDQQNQLSAVQSAKATQDKLDYVAKQKSACLDIYQAESKKWNNTESWNYDEANDNCVITYNLPADQKEPKSQCESEEASCTKLFKGFNLQCADDYANCLDGTFTKTF